VNKSMTGLNLSLRCGTGFCKGFFRGQFDFDCFYMLRYPSIYVEVETPEEGALKHSFSFTPSPFKGEVWEWVVVSITGKFCT